MDGNGQQQEPPSLDFWALFIKKKCLARPAKEGKKKPTGLRRKEASRAQRQKASTSQRAQTNPSIKPNKSS